MGQESRVVSHASAIGSQEQIKKFQIVLEYGPQRLFEVGLFIPGSRCLDASPIWDTMLSNGGERRVV